MIIEIVTNFFLSIIDQSIYCFSCSVVSLACLPHPIVKQSPLFQTEAQCLTWQFTLRGVWEFKLLPPVNLQLPVSLCSEAWRSRLLFLPHPWKQRCALLDEVACLGWSPQGWCLLQPSAPGHYADDVSVSGLLSSSWRFAAAFFSWGTEGMEVTQPRSWRTDWTGRGSELT